MVQKYRSHLDVASVRYYFDKKEANIPHSHSMCYGCDALQLSCDALVIRTLYARDKQNICCTSYLTRRKVVEPANASE